MNKIKQYIEDRVDEFEEKTKLGQFGFLSPDNYFDIKNFQEKTIKGLIKVIMEEIEKSKKEDMEDLIGWEAGRIWNEAHQYEVAEKEAYNQAISDTINKLKTIIK